MTRAVVLFFLGASPDAHQADLEAWARARLVEIREPEADRPGLGYSAETAAQIEADLEAARLAFATLDDERGKARLAAAERALRAAPGLPQAAWLLAETLDIQADVAARAGDAALAARLSERARILEGQRAPSFGEPSAGAAATPPPPVVRVTGLEQGDQLYWNAVLGSHRVRAAAGEHHARVVRRGRAVWAGWVNVAPGARTVALPVPAPTTCSIDDLAGARVVGERAVARPGTRCDRWALARPAAGGGIEIASCEGARCGPLVHWERGYGSIYDGPPQPRAARGGLPTWATIALAGAGAVLIGGAIAWQAGAFEDEGPADTRFRFYGP